MIFDNYSFQTEILAASVRHAQHVLECARVGADVSTLPLKVILSLFGAKRFIPANESQYKNIEEIGRELGKIN